MKISFASTLSWWAALGCWAAAPLRADQTVAAYDAGVSGLAPDPASQSWVAGVPAADAANFQSLGLSPDGATGWNAWRMLDNSSSAGQFLTWTRPFTEQEHLDAYNKGWNLRARLRAVDPVAGNAGGNAVVLLYGNHSQAPAGSARRFILFLDVNAAGALVASLAGGPTVTLAGVDAARYHLHEFEFDGASKTANYLVDGVVKASGYAGTGTSFNGVQWGTGSSGGRGDGYWNEVRFTIREALSVPQLLASPVGKTIQTGESLTLSAAFSGIITSYEWLKDGFPVEGGTGPTLTIPFALAGDAASYVLRASNGAGFTDSEAAVVVVAPDTVPPKVKALEVSVFAARLRLEVSEPLDDSKALDPAAYGISGGVALRTVTKVNAFTYDLAVEPRPAEGALYQLSLVGIADLAGNAFAEVDARVSARAASGLPLMGRLAVAFSGETAEAHPLDGVTWRDGTGNGNHAISPGASHAVTLRRPSLVAGGLKGRDTLAFSRTRQQFLAIPGAGATGLDGEDFTFFIVAKPTAAPAAGQFPNMLRHQSDFHAANWGAYFFAGNSATSSQAALVVSARNGSGGEVPCFVNPVTFGRWMLLTGQVAGSTGTSLGRLEDCAVTPAEVRENSAAGSLRLGATPLATYLGRSPAGDGSNDSFDGEMAEVLIYAGALDEAERAEVELYLRQRYFAMEVPEIVLQPRPNGDLEIRFTGLLQHSADLDHWTPLEVSSPWVVPAEARLLREFFRSVFP